MQIFGKIGVIAGAFFAMLSPVSAAVLNFDDLGTGPSFFTSDYNGFQFGTNDISDTAWFNTQQSSPFYTPSSGAGYIATDFSLYNKANPYEATQPIRRSTAFIFDGAYFSGGDTIGYQLYLDGNPVFTSLPSVALTAVPTFVASGYSGAVNSVVIFGRQGYYALDDFTYRAVGSTMGAAPEPAAWTMMIVGFGLTGGTMRRRRLLKLAV